MNWTDCLPCFDKLAPPKRRRCAAGTARWTTIIWLVVAAGIAVRLLGPQTLGETVRRKVVAQLRAHYPGLDISIGRGTFDPHRGMILEDLVIRVAPAGGRAMFGPRGPVLARVGEIIASGSIDAAKLRSVENPFATERVAISDIELNVWPTAAGPSSIESLLPLPTFGGVTPRTDFHKLRIRLHRGIPTPNSRPIECVCRVATLLQNEDAGRMTRKLIASGSADFIDAWTMAANMASQPGQSPIIDVRSKIDAVRVDPSLWRRLPPVFAAKVRDAIGLRCTADIQAAWFRRASQSVLGETQSDDFLVKANIHDGSMTHAKLPLPFDDLNCQLEWSPTALIVRSASLSVAGSPLRGIATIDNPLSDPVIDARIAASGFRVRRALVASMPPSLQAAWDKLRIEGALDAQLHVRHRLANPPGTPIDIDGQLICKGIDVNFHRFPLPVTQIVGPIQIADGRMTSDDLRGQVGEETMRCRFDLPLSPKIGGSPSTPAKWFEASLDGPVAIGDSLLSALTPRGETRSTLQRFAQSITPRGSIALQIARFATDAAGQQHRQIDMRVVGGHLRYDKFPYPIYNVDGRITVVDDDVQIEDFTGTHVGGGSLRCSGSMHLAATSADGAPPPVQADENDLQLHFDVARLAMDVGLRDALPPSSIQVWDSIAPAGVLDDVVVNLRSRGDAPLEMDLTARQNDRAVVSADTLSLRPSSLPYRLDVTSGTVHYDGYSVHIDNITGVNNGSRLAASGRCYARKDGRWVLAIDVLGGSRLVPDTELISSLPESMRGALKSLQLRDPVNIRGHSELVLPDATSTEPIVDWDLILALEGNDIGDGGPIRAIRGEIAVRGRRDADTLTADGNVRIDSLHFYDQQITGIAGPFRIVDETLTLGRGTQGSNADGELLVGQLFGGEVGLGGSVMLGSGDFELAMSLRNASLPSLLADFGYSNQDLTGAISANSRLQGSLSTIEVLKGDGNARISGANVYELPLLVQVLNQLRISPSPKNAFTDAQMEFSLFADHVTMRELQIWGDLVSLHGGGTLNGRQELDLTFNTRVSPQNIISRAIRPLRDSRYTLWTVDVTGPLTDPNIERRALDGMGETLERLFDGGGDPETSTASESRPKLFGKWRS